jgi:hypothetical protein
VDKFVAYSLWVGEIFDLETRAGLRRRGRWEFLSSGPPLRITCGVGSPLTPVTVFCATHGVTAANCVTVIHGPRGRGVGCHSGENAVHLAFAERKPSEDVRLLLRS